MFSIRLTMTRVAVPALIGCGLVACAVTPKSAAQRAADAATVEHVQAALNADQSLYSRHINVRADGDVVTLSGYVWTPEEQTAAREDAQAVPGVAKVVDRMEIDRGAVNDSNVTR